MKIVELEPLRKIPQGRDEEKQFIKILPGPQDHFTPLYRFDIVLCWRPVMIALMINDPAIFSRKPHNGFRSILFQAIGSQQAFGNKYFMLADLSFPQQELPPAKFSHGCLPKHQPE